MGTDHTGGDRIGRIRAGDQADRHGEREVFQRLAAEEEHRDDGDERGDRCVHAPHSG